MPDMDRCLAFCLRHVRSESQSRLPIWLQNRGGSGVVQAEEVEVTLAAGETREVRLQLRPQMAGSLTIRGITWTLSDIARGERIFKLPAARHGSRCCNPKLKPLQ